MRKFRKTTIKDVAERAGVSITAVSLYLRGKREVCSPDTARRIDEAVETLHYSAAPALRWQERGTRTIGLCVGLPYRAVEEAETRRDSFAEQIWRGALQVADRQSYSLLHFPKEIRDSSSPGPFLDGRVDGLLLFPGYNDPRPPRLAAAGLPTVLVARSRTVPASCQAVFTMEGDTVELALSHLWKLGHRRIAHIAGPVEEPTPEATEAARAAGQVIYDPSDMALSRQERYVSWLRVRRAFDPTLLSLAGGWGFSRSRAAALVALWQQMVDPPTAVFCANDEIALAVMHAARAAGLRVPGDLSIVGVDDSPRAAAADPALTSVRLPGEEVGREAMRCLLRSLHSEESSAPSESPEGPEGPEGAESAEDSPEAMIPRAEGRAVATAALEAAALAAPSADEDECRIGIPVTRLVVRASTGPPPQPVS